MSSRRVLIAQPWFYADSSVVGNERYMVILQQLKKMGYRVDTANVSYTDAAFTQSFIDNYEFVVVPTVRTTSSAWAAGRQIVDLVDGTLDAVVFVEQFTDSAANAYLNAYFGISDDNEGATAPGGGAVGNTWQRYVYNGIDFDWYGPTRLVATADAAYVTPYITLKSNSAQMLVWKLERPSESPKYVYCSDLGNNFIGMLPLMMQEAILAGDITVPKRKLGLMYDCDHWNEQDANMLPSDLDTAHDLLEQYGIKMTWGIQSGIGVIGGSNKWSAGSSVEQKNQFNKHAATRYAIWEACMHTHEWEWDGQWPNITTKQSYDQAYRDDCKRVSDWGLTPGSDTMFDADGYIHNPTDSYSEEQFMLISGRLAPEAVVASPLNNVVGQGYGIPVCRVAQNSYPNGSRPGAIDTGGGARQYSFGVEMIHNQVQEANNFSTSMAAGSADEIKSFSYSLWSLFHQIGAYGHTGYLHSSAFSTVGTRTAPYLRLFENIGKIQARLSDVLRFKFPSEGRKVWNKRDDWMPEDLGDIAIRYSGDSIHSTCTSIFFNTWADSSQAPTDNACGGWYDQATPNTTNDFIGPGHHAQQLTQSDKPLVVMDGDRRCLEFDGANHYLDIPDGSAAFSEGGDWTLVMHVSFDTTGTQALLSQTVDQDTTWYIRYSTGNIQIAAKVDGISVITQTSLSWTPTVDTFYTLIFEIDRTNDIIRLYVDGVLIDSDSTNNPATWPALDNGGDLEIGVFYGTGGGFSGWFLDGTLEHFMVFTDILTTAEKTKLIQYIIDHGYMGNIV